MTPTPPTTVTFDAVWTGDGFRGPAAYRLHDERLEPIDGSATGQGARPAPTPAADAHHLGGTLFPRLTDHHVHLGLVDAAALFAGGISRAHDLGWTPSVAAGWLRDDPHLPETAIAGALLTAPGGYPVRSAWAPAGAAREVGGPRDGRRAVREQVMTGASRIKVALNSEVGETVDDATLRAIVEEAVTAGLPVAAHVQGEGQTLRAVRAGVGILAHTPFSERVDDRVIAEAVRRGMSWISTLDIHGWGAPTAERACAIENLRRFHAAGGRVLYGTDLGNGPLPLGVNARELTALRQAGLGPVELIRSIAGGADENPHDAHAHLLGPRFAWIPTAPPGELADADSRGDLATQVDPASHADLPTWLATARGLHLRFPLPPQPPGLPGTPTTPSRTQGARA